MSPKLDQWMMMARYLGWSNMSPSHIKGIFIPYWQTLPALSAPMHSPPYQTMSTRQDYYQDRTLYPGQIEMEFLVGQHLLDRVMTALR
jgi:hypothetical protein